MTIDVVVTGLGVIAPTGRGVTEAWQGVLAGKGRAALDEVLVAAGSPVTLACRVPSFDPDAELGRGAGRRQDRYTHLALIAAIEAVAHAGISAETVDLDRVGVVLGCGIGGVETWENDHRKFVDEGPARVSPMFIPKLLSNTAAGAIAMRTGARGPNMTVNTACAAGASALHMGRDLIRSGQADIVICGGAEAAISPMAVAAFAQMGALTKHDDPTNASRPFDVARDGFVMGEGAGVVILESAAHAEARGATALARLAGCGASADAHHPTAPPEDGAGAVLAITRALADAGVEPTDVVHVNAHGTSTPLNDAAEARALRTVFGDHAPSLIVSSTKGATGHLLGAAGAVEAVFAVMALRESVAPPTAGLRDLDDVGLQVVNATTAIGPGAVLSDSFGFGGQNAALVFTAV